MQAHLLIASKEVWALTLLIVLVVLMLLVICLICLQPREARRRLFRVPFVPTSILDIDFPRLFKRVSCLQFINISDLHINL